MRPQLLAWLAVGIVALYVLASVMGRLSDGRCRADGWIVECGFRKPVVVVPDGPGVMA